MKPITVMLVDDHTLMRDAVGFSLSLYPHFQVVASTGHINQALELAAQYSPDIIMLDINMHGWSGFDMIKQLMACSPLSRVIGLSAHRLPVYAKKMIKMGASGYLTKSSSMDEMTMAIEKVSKGNIFVCHEIVSLAMGETNVPAFHLLTEREIEIINLLNKQLSSKEIAVGAGYQRENS